jgi:hypothetical protein
MGSTSGCQVACRWDFTSVAVKKELRKAPGQGAADYEELRGLRIDNLKSEIGNEKETRLLCHASPYASSS